MDHYEDKNLIVRTSGGWGSARELAEKAIDHNIQNAVERLASGIDAEAITQRKLEQDRRIQAEMAEAQRLRELRQRALEAERTKLAREREGREHGGNIGHITQGPPIPRVEPSATDRAKEEASQRRHEEFLKARKLARERAEREQADSRARHAQKMERIRADTARLRALTRER